MLDGQQPMLKLLQSLVDEQVRQGEQQAKDALVLERIEKDLSQVRARRGSHAEE